MDPYTGVVTHTLSKAEEAAAARERQREYMRKYRSNMAPERRAAVRSRAVERQRLRRQMDRASLDAIALGEHRAKEAQLRRERRARATQRAAKAQGKPSQHAQRSQSPQGEPPQLDQNQHDHNQRGQPAQRKPPQFYQNPHGHNQRGQPAQGKPPQYDQRSQRNQPVLQGGRGTEYDARDEMHDPAQGSRISHDDVRGQTNEPAQGDRVIQDDARDRPVVSDTGNAQSRSNRSKNNSMAKCSRRPKQSRAGAAMGKPADVSSIAAVTSAAQLPAPTVVLPSQTSVVSPQTPASTTIDAAGRSTATAVRTSARTHAPVLAALLGAVRVETASGGGGGMAAESGGSSGLRQLQSLRPTLPPSPLQPLTTAMTTTLATEAASEAATLFRTLDSALVADGGAGKAAHSGSDAEPPAKRSAVDVSSLR